MADNVEVPIIRLCTVISVDDNTDSNRIKVRLDSEDAGIPDAKLPYVIPLLPQMLHIKPKKGEAVLVLTAIANEGNSQRYYIGPVISQINQMYNEPMHDALSQYESAMSKKEPAQTADVNKTKGAVPKDDEIAIIGRKNTDIIISDDDLRIRAGAKKVDELQKNTFSFNSDTPAYIKLKYHPDGLENIEKCNSTATIVADKINLIGNMKGQNDKRPYDMSNTDEFIDDENMSKLIESAHRVPYGDLLVDFLKLFRNAFLNHTHRISMMSPVIDPNYSKPLSDYDMDKMLSDSVRVN